VVNFNNQVQTQFARVFGGKWYVSSSNSLLAWQWDCNSHLWSPENWVWTWLL